MPHAQRRRICRLVKEIWIDIAGPNPRYARGFFAKLHGFGCVKWLAPSAEHFARFRRTLRKILAPGYIASLALV